ncbi:gene transfer agent family protein [Tianweitania sediminis]|uniref:Gene transfer agent family protein n=1 Tax=Tianweitania sediminis TaxID=1502156 RepID=A0A8J7RPE9_9HYPH|nr:gene transfer agent family protein [Tianweitania sediminis]MBP0439584.1 gene transfer agent family protein [Tianweitania sediminis]
MARLAELVQDFADGAYTFRLRWAEIIKLQEATDTGPYVLLQRLYQGEWRVQDISAVIRLGLIGGGMEPTAALRLVRSYVEERPPLESLPLAQAVLAAGLVGAPEEALGKDQAPDRARSSTISPTGSSGSEPSMVPAPASA